MLFDDPALRQLKSAFSSEKVRKEGFVKATDRGFGFLEVEKDSFFITPDDMKKVMSGDRIVAYLEDDRNGKSHAVPEKLVTPYLDRFVARIDHIAGDKITVSVDNPAIKTKLRADDVRKDKSSKLKHGDWVICKLKKHALKDNCFFANLIEFVCDKDDPKTPWTVSLRRYDLPLVEPADAKFNFLEENLEREDLRELPFVTIDSAHTEDMDDALYIEKNGDTFTLYTAIADPTGYVSEDSELNELASKRSFSIYLPGRDIPMLPRVLSQDLCSLRANEDRPALVGIMTVKADGELVTEKTRFTLATIKSHGKLIYNDVSDYLEGIEEASFKPDDVTKAQLEILVEFTKVRDHYRSTHAATFKNRPDYEFILKDNGALDHIEVNHRRIANQIVEECMIVSNVAAGSYLSENLKSGIFNIHRGFDMKKRRDIVELLNKENCPFEEDKLDTLSEYNRIRRFALDNNNDYLDSRIRKLQEFSEMGIAPGPHYALGVENYATWTSPIRKYGDMVNHRLIKSVIASTVSPKLPDETLLKIMNESKRTNRMAERDVRDWLYVEFLEPEIEKKTAFTGVIFDISRGGIKVLLEENGAMVFMPYSMMCTDNESLTLVSDSGCVLVKNECVYRLGDKMKVKVVEVNKATRSIIAAPVESVGGLMLPDPYAPKVQTKTPGKRR